MPQNLSCDFPDLIVVFEELKRFVNEEDDPEFLEDVIRAKELTRDAFFKEAAWAILASGVKVRVAELVREKAVRSQFPLKPEEWKLLATWRQGEFNSWCKKMAGSLQQPRTDLVGRFRDKWTSIWDLALWLDGFKDDQDFQREVFGSKDYGNQLNDDDIERLARIKRETKRLQGIGYANRYFILRNLGGDFLKPDVWVQAFADWYEGGVSVSELATLLKDAGIHCGRFDAYLWTYCESEIEVSKNLNSHFDEVFLQDTYLSDVVSESMCSVEKFEEQVWKREGIRIVVRDEDSTTSLIHPYDYIKKANRSWTIKRWVNTRIKWFIGDSRNVVVVSGDGTLPHGKNQLQTVRDSYGKL